MSSGQGWGSVIGGVIGAAAGAFLTVGNPAAIAAGYTLGSALGGALDPPKGPTVSGPRLSDLTVQTATYGAPITRFYGTVPVHGNVLWLKGGKLDEHVKKKKQGGKGGGGGTTTKTYTYSGTFILGLGGPIAGVRRIWCLDKLIYNAGSDDLETIIASNQAANAWTIYTGTDDQMPDPDYEADVGVGNAPALRGMSYIKFKDFQLADYNNSLQGAQFKVEVVSSMSDEVSLLLQREDDYIHAASGLCFGASSENLVSISYERVSAGDEFLYSKNFLSRRQGGLVKHVDVGVRAFILRSIGPTTTAYLTDDFRVVTDVGEFVFGTLPGSSFQSVIMAGAMFIVTSGRPLVRASVAPTLVPVISKSDRLIVSICPAPDCLIALTIDHILRIDPETLDELSAVEYDSTLSAVGSGVYISFDDGGMWLLPRGSTQIAEKFDVTTGAKIAEAHGFPGGSGGTNGMPGHISNGVYTRVDDRGLGDSRVESFNLRAISVSSPALSSIIEAESARSSLLSANDIDASLITDTLIGYRVSGGTIRATLEQPQGAYPFDVIQSGYKIKCVPRGKASVVTIPWEHLGADDSDEAGDLITQSREMDSQLPAITAVSYLSSEREYATGEQIAQRINTAAVNRNDLELAMVLTDDKAAQVAEVLQGIAWLERTDFSVTLPPIYLPLEPSDVVTVTSKNATYELRLTEVNYTPDGRLECKTKPNRAALYTSNATGGSGVAPPGTIGLPGPSLIVEMDTPLVDEVSQNAVGFVTAATGYTEGWPGAVLVRSADGGQTWEDLQAYTGKGGIGFATGTLPVSAGHLIDQRSLVVSFISGEPESITLAQLLTGYNYAAYGVNGRWEIVRFQTATLNADSTYTLSGFVRGDKGTEWATGLHVAGDYFILLDDPDNAFIGTAVQTIGLARDYRAVTSGASVDDAENTVFTYNGVNLECLSPVNARATRDGSGNLAATFTRRSRLGSTWWGNGVEAPVGETTQAYEIDVMSGATVKRTITATTPAFSYSAADQTTDFGSAQASITFRIYQLSEIVGRGYVREVTL